MCSCQRHNDSSVACTCVCVHPGDSILVRARKRARLQLARTQYEVGKRREKALMAVAWKCPRELAYWIGIRIAVENSPDYPAEQKVGEVLEKWRRKTE